VDGEGKPAESVAVNNKIAVMSVRRRKSLKRTIERAHRRVPLGDKELMGDEDAFARRKKKDFRQICVPWLIGKG